MKMKRMNITVEGIQLRPSIHLVRAARYHGGYQVTVTMVTYLHPAVTGWNIPAITLPVKIPMVIMS